MGTKHILYTTGLTLYSKTVEDSTPWATDVQAITEDGTYPGVYPVDTDHPYLYVQAGGSPASTDTNLGDAREFYYGTVADGDLYHQRRVHAWDWENGTTEDKVKALYTATEAVDKFNFIGDKVSDDQLREFPRDRTLDDDSLVLIGGTAGVPTAIEESIYLIADALIGGRDPQADFEAQNVKVETFGPVRTEFATNVGPMAHVANLIPSASAWAKILPFLGISTSFYVKKA